MTQKSIKKNTIYNAIKTLSTIVFPLITFPYASRVLLPDNMGKIDFGSSVVSYFGLLASLGITTYAIRECSAVRNNKQELSNIASQIYSINIITTIISYLLLCLTLVFYRKLENYRTLIIIQSLSILATTLGTDWLNSAMEDFKYITIRSVCFQVISLGLMFIFIHHPEDYMKYSVISLLSSAGANIVNICYRKKYCEVRFIRDIKNGLRWKSHMVPIMLLFVMLLAQTIFNSVDKTMLGIMHGDYEVGIYGTAHKISNIITQLVTSILWVIMPRMSYYFAEGDYSKINQFLRKILGFNALLGLPCAVGTFFLSDEIILIIAGNEYSEASSVLKILMIGFVFTLFGGGFLGNSVLLPAKKEKQFMIICCIAAVVNVITNYIFIPMYGACAAAGTTVLCALVILVVLICTMDKKIHIDNIISLLITPVIGCGGIAIVCIVCRNIANLWGRTVCSVTISVCLYFAVTYFGNNEMMRSSTDGIINRLKRRYNK